MPSYSEVHRHPTNLVIHVFAVPVFVLACLIVVTSVFLHEWLVAAVAALAVLLSLALQGFGHTKEAIAPEPFADAGDFMRRVLREQFLLFPVYFLSGEWMRAWRGSRPDS